ISMDGLNKTFHRGCSRSDLTFHAAAGIQYDAEADRRVIRKADVRYRQSLTVFFDNKVAGSEIRNVSVAVICNRSNDIYECDVDRELRESSRSDKQNYH